MATLIFRAVNTDKKNQKFTNLGTQLGTEGCTLPPSRSFDKLELTGVKILLLIFLIKNFVKEELFSSNASKIKNLERWTFRKRHLVEAL